jgi:hypothetical protein
MVEGQKRKINENRGAKDGLANDELRIATRGLIQRAVKSGRFTSQKSKIVARIMTTRNNPPRNRTCRWCCVSLGFLF